MSASYWLPSHIAEGLQKQMARFSEITDQIFIHRRHLNYGFDDYGPWEGWPIREPHLHPVKCFVRGHLDFRAPDTLIEAQGQKE